MDTRKTVEVSALTVPIRGCSVVADVHRPATSFSLLDDLCVCEEVCSRSCESGTVRVVRQGWDTGEVLDERLNMSARQFQV